MRSFARPLRLPKRFDKNCGPGRFVLRPLLQASVPLPYDPQPGPKLLSFCLERVAKPSPWPARLRGGEPQVARPGAGTGGLLSPGGRASEGFCNTLLEDVSKPLGGSGALIVRRPKPASPPATSGSLAARQFAARGFCNRLLGILESVERHYDHALIWLESAKTAAQTPAGGQWARPCRAPV